MREFSTVDQSQMRTGGRGQKNPKFCGRHIWMAPKPSSLPPLNSIALHSVGSRGDSLPPENSRHEPGAELRPLQRHRVQPDVPVARTTATVLLGCLLRAQAGTLYLGEGASINYDLIVFLPSPSTGWPIWPRKTSNSKFRCSTNFLY